VATTHTFNIQISDPSILVFNGTVSHFYIWPPSILNFWLILLSGAQVFIYQS